MSSTISPSSDGDETGTIGGAEGDGPTEVEDGVLKGLMGAILIFAGGSFVTGEAVNGEIFVVEVEDLGEENDDLDADAVRDVEIPEVVDDTEVINVVDVFDGIVDGSGEIVGAETLDTVNSVDAEIVDNADAEVVSVEVVVGVEFNDDVGVEVIVDVEDATEVNSAEVAANEIVASEFSNGIGIDENTSDIRVGFVSSNVVEVASVAVDGIDGIISSSEMSGEIVKEEISSFLCG